jgi:FkbM family methyltransferase
VVTGGRLSLLASLLEAPVVVVDAGCRWGFADVWGDIGDRCAAIGFEPDIEECEQLARRYGDRPNVRIVPLALGSRRGPATLYVTKERAGSSLFPQHPDAERYPNLSPGRVEHTVDVELDTLDNWAAVEGVDRVDVIKVDTQGAELDVLKGATRVLDDVRAIEVEVEFNPLYEGIPLFGDIDRFLRRRGFVLWTLKHLCFYSQAGAFTDWRMRERHYFDARPADVWAGAGQLFWADAFYVRREIAHPGPGRSWQQAVRDACITSALALPDLAGRLIAEARDLAPDSAVATLDEASALMVEALVSGENDRVAELEALVARRGDALAHRSVPLEREVVIDVGASSFRGSGWQHLQRFGSGWLRWTGPSREATVDAPYLLAPGVRIDLLVVSAMSPRILDELELEVNRVPVPLTRHAHGKGIVFSGVIPRDYAPRRRFTRLVLRTSETVLWSDRHPEAVGEDHSDDELGLALAWVRLVPPSPPHHNASV